MAIKLIAIDIDGTLINSKREITPRVKAALNAASAQGVYVVLCTGRPYPGVEGLLQELDLVNDHDYVVTSTELWCNKQVRKKHSFASQ